MSINDHKIIKGLEKKLNEHIEMALADYKEALIRQAVLDFDTQLRKRIGQAVFNLSEYYTMETMQHQIVITVKLDREEKK